MSMEQSNLSTLSRKEEEMTAIGTVYYPDGDVGELTADESNRLIVSVIRKHLQFELSLIPSIAIA